MSIHPTRPTEQPNDLGPLIALAAQGDERAWVDLVDLYARRVFAMARSRLHDDELAEEITQSVFVTVAMKLNGNEGYAEMGRFEPWLFRITMNRVRDLCRKRKRHATPTDPEHLNRHESKDEQDDAKETKQAELGQLREVLDRLSDADREIIELRHHGQLSFKQIAELLGQPVGTLLARHHRALKKMREQIEAMNQNTGSNGLPKEQA
ncbi:MAG: sigma-70 family RNA polymerase sigma factor [Phycisphaerales bacterium]|nr:sigma-70 family RNA polymerase sigma factor [Phycisphaerales bacterium]